MPLYAQFAIVLRLRKPIDIKCRTNEKEAKIEAKCKHKRKGGLGRRKSGKE